MDRYEGQVGGKPIVYTPDGIQFGSVPVPFDQMTDIKIMEGASPSWQFTFNGRRMQVPYGEEERAFVEPFINEAIVSEALKSMDPVGMELPGAAATGQPQAPGADAFVPPSGQPEAGGFSMPSGQPSAGTTAGYDIPQPGMQENNSDFQMMPQVQQPNGFNTPGGQNGLPGNQAAQMRQAGMGMQDPTVVNQIRVETNQYQGQNLQAFERRVNKHVFVWVCTFLVGGFGVDRFMRGQVGLGILKIITCSGVGVWATIDWIMAMVKAYGSAFGQEEELVFLNGKYAR